MKTKLFKIGELSNFFHISVDSIRYYEKCGILHPVRNPENNYRLYTLDDFRQLALIRELLGLGFSTDQIKNYMTDRNVYKTRDMLITQLSAIDEQINSLRHAKSDIKNRLNTMNNMLEQYTDEKIRVLDIPERGCIMIREKNSPNDMVDYYRISYSNKSQIALGNVGMCDCYTLDLPGSNPASDYYRTKNVFFYSESFSKEDCNYFLPKGKYLSVLYRGQLTKTKELLPKLFNYADEKGLLPAGDPIEFCYIDEYETNNPDEYLVEIQLLVKS